jgi:hypothetical protein
LKHGTWSFYPALDAFKDSRDKWDRLNASQNNHILLDSGFVEILLRYFGSPDALLAINEDPAHPAMAVVERKGQGIWETFMPAWAPLGLILYGDGDAGGEILRSLMRSLPGYAAQLGVLQQDPNCFGLSTVSECDWVEKSDYMRTARIQLDGTFQEYWSAREDRLRKNNDRLRRRMGEKGLSLEFNIIRDPAGVEGGILEFARMESKGWKAGAGTAVRADDVQGRFYRTVFEHFCERGEGVIYQLRINGQVVATDICLVREAMLILIKTAYDEDWSAYAPGVLLREDILRDLYSGGRIRNYEFYGPLMDYQLRWTQDVRTLYHLTCFRHPWVRAARTLVKRVRRRQVAS